MDLWKDAETSQMDKRDSQLEAAILQDEVGHMCKKQNECKFAIKNN